MRMRKRVTLLCCAVLLPALACLPARAAGQVVRRAGTDPAAQDPNVFFFEDFESGNLDKWDEDTDKGQPRRLRVIADASKAYTGAHAAEITALTGNGTGAKLNKWFRPGYEKVYARWYTKLAKDFDVTAMHGCQVLGNHPDNKWSAYGKAGWTPGGDKWFCTNVDKFAMRGKDGKPSYYLPTFYTYHMDKRPGFPAPIYAEEGMGFRPGRWHCVEVMVKVNTPGMRDGEQALWIDGKPVLHVKRLRWRTVDYMKVDNLWLQLFVHHNKKGPQKVWFDNVAIGTEYIGTREHPKDLYPTAEFVARKADSSTLRNWGTLRVVFDGSQSSDTDGRLTEWRWDFGDGTESKGTSVTHTYAREGDYTVTLTVKDDRGAPDTTQHTISVRKTTGVGVGLRGEYFNSLEPDGEPARRRLDAEVDFLWRTWDTGKPSINVRRKDISVRWTGKVQPRVTGYHTFYVTMADGARLWVDGQLIARDVKTLNALTREKLSKGDYSGRKREVSGKVRIEAGKLYDIRLEVYQQAGGGEARLWWESGDFSKQLIPTTQLYPPDPGHLKFQRNRYPYARFHAIGEWGSLEVKFDASKSSDPDGKVVRYLWDFGDGSKGTGKTCAHRFGKPGEYLVELAVEDDRGGQYRKTHAITVGPNVGAGTGLLAECRDGVKGDGKYSVRRLDPQVNFSWRTWQERYPAYLVGYKSFRARWTGKIQPLVSGRHTFSVVMADAARLCIGGKLVVEDTATLGAGKTGAGKRGREISGAAALEAGKLYDIRLDVHQADHGGGAAVLYWTPPGGRKHVVPRSQLYPVIQ